MSRGQVSSNRGARLFLGIRGNFIPPMPKSKPPDLPFSWARAFKAYARLSGGSEYRLGVMASEPNSLFDGSVPAFSVEIPGDYPDTCRWIDVTVETVDGHRATWRIVNLPRTHRVIQRPIRFNSTVTTPEGATVKGIPKQLRPGWRYMDYLLMPVNSAKGEYWQFTPSPDEPRREWETRDVELQRRQSNPTIDYSKWSRLFHSKGGTHVTSLPIFGKDPSSRYLRVFGDIAHIGTWTKPSRFTMCPCNHCGVVDKCLSWLHRPR
jgi:hypothetical protein